MAKQTLSSRLSAARKQATLKESTTRLQKVSTREAVALLRADIAR